MSVDTAEDTNVGGIVAHLRVDGGEEWARAFERAQRQAEALGRVSPRVRVDVDTAAALTRLRTFSADVERLGAANLALRLDLTAAQRQIEELRQRTGRQAAITGRDFGAQFSRGLRETLATLPKVEVRADTSDVGRQLAEVRAELEALGSTTIGTDLSSGQAVARLAELQAQLQTLRAGATDIAVQFNTAAATARIARLQAQLGQLGDVDGGQLAGRLAKAIKEATAALPKIDIDADSTPAQRELAEVRARLVELGQQRVGIDLTAADALGRVKLLQGELDRLTLRAKSDIQVRVDTGAAAAKLAALRAQVEGISAGQAGASGPSSLSLPSPLVAGVLSALPLIGPLAGAASAALGSFAGAAGVAGLAVGGMNKEIEKDSTLGQRVAGQITGLSNALTQLQGTAAKGASGGVLSGFRQLNAFLPTLNPIVAELSKHLGNAFSVATGGLISGLTTASPLLSDAGKYAELLAQKLASAARSPEFAAFIAYARRELPIVVSTLGNLTSAAVHLGEALAPLGTVVLAGLNGLSATLNALPVPVLTALAVGAGAAYVAFKGLAIITVVNEALTAYSTRAMIAAGVSRRLAAANASAASGAGILAGRFGALGVAGAAAGAILVGAHYISKEFTALPATAEAAARALDKLGRSGEITRDLLGSFGATGKDLHSVLENAFARSNWTRINDFDFGLHKLGITMNNATRDSANFFKSADDGLTQMVGDGNKLGASNAFDVLAEAAKKQGVTVDQLLSKLPKYKAALDVIATSVGQAGAAALAAAGSFEAAGEKYGVSAKAAEDYAGMVGITAEEVGKGTVSQLELNHAVAMVTGHYRDATAANAAYLQAVSDFASGTGTAAERAALIGATLRASNGDLLSYAGSMVGAATANQTFVTEFDNARKAAKDAKVAFDEAKTGVVDLATGSLNYKNAAAGPLIAGLQAMQDAAEKAAGATYQHELAQRGAATASQLAVEVYRSQTSGALVAEAKQLGLTTRQAQALADRYLSMPTDIETKIKAIGTDPVVTVLDRIGQQLSYLTGHQWGPTVNANTVEAKANLAIVERLLRATSGTKTATVVANVGAARGTLSRFLSEPAVKYVQVVTVNTKTGQAFGGRQVFADGGTVAGEGGPRDDRVLIRASPGEEIIKNGPAQRHRALLKAINAERFADGGTVGGFVGVHAPPPTLAESRAGTSPAAKIAKARKAAKAKEVIVTLRATADGGSVYGIASYIKGQIPSSVAAMRLLSTAVNDAYSLKRLRAETASAKTELDRLREKAQQLANDAGGKLTEGSDPSGFQTVDQYAAFLRAKGDQNARYNTEIHKLRGNKAIPADLLARFAADGPSSILDSLAGASRGSIAALVKASGRFDSSVTAGRGQAAAIYGPSIAVQNAMLGKFTAQSARTETALVGVVLKLAQIVNRPAKIVVDGKTWATTKYVDKELQGVIDELRNVLVTGRTGH